MVCAIRPSIEDIGTRVTRVPYHKVPHTYLGTVQGFEECQIYVFFPHLYRKERPSNYLTVDQSYRFFDHLLGAIRDCGFYNAGELQHLPTSAAHACSNSYAASRETGNTLLTSAPRQQALHYYLNHRGLNAVTQRLGQSLTQSSNFDLLDFVLLISAKDLKSMFRASSLGDLFTIFQARWNPIFDFTYLKSSNTWVDIGKETIYDVQWQDLRPDDIPEVDHNQDAAYSSNAASYASSEADEIEARQPYTYLWRKSYLDQVYTRFKMGVPRDGFRRNIYPFSLLDEVCSMTLEPGKTHPLKLVGLIYSQYYSSTKEIFDVAKVYPWDNNSLEGLAIDPLLHEEWKKLANFSGATWNHQKVTSSYIAAKNRVSIALRGARFRSYGTREEHRLSMTLLLNIGTRLHQRNLTNNQVCLKPGYFVTIPTNSMVNYLYANISKFAFGFEHSLIRDGGRHISPASTQMARVFLQFLRASYQEYPLGRQNGMWLAFKENQSNDSKAYGLGLKETMKSTGYGFIIPSRIQWSSWQFCPHMAKSTLFTEWTIQRPFTKAYKEVQQSAAFNSNCHELLTWLQKQFQNGSTWSMSSSCSTSSSCSRTSYHGYQALQIIWKWLVENLVWGFQQEVLNACSGDLQDGKQEWSPNGFHFSVDKLSLQMKGKLNLVGYNSNGRQQPKTPLQRLQHLWEFEDGLARKSWKNKPYRLRYQQVVSLWNSLLGPLGWPWSHKEFYKFFIRRCTVWPNSTTSCWFPLKNHSRVWHGLKDYTPVNEPTEWMSALRGGLYCKKCPLQVSQLWVNQNSQKILSYIEECKKGLFWSDLGELYEWSWGQVDEMECCTGGHMSNHHPPIHEPRVRLLWR